MKYDKIFMPQIIFQSLANPLTIKIFLKNVLTNNLKDNNLQKLEILKFNIQRAAPKSFLCEISLFRSS